MKKNLRILAAFLMSAALLVSFASCDDGSGTKKPPKVTSVAIGDANGDPLIGPVEGVIGTTRQFSAIVEVTNGAPKTVKWEVASDQTEGLVAGTGISDDGLLTISGDESEGTTLTVTATSTKDAKKSASINVALVKTGTISYTITIGTYEHGIIDGPDSAKAGEEITLTIHPDSGYKLAAIEITGVTLNGTGDGDGDTRTFTMPSNNVTVTASFSELPAGTHSVIIRIKAGDENKGNVTASPSFATANTPITLTITLQTGFDVNQIVVLTSSGNEVPLPGSDADLSRTFTMPDDNVEVHASFKEIGSATTFMVSITGNDSHGTVTANPDGGALDTLITLTVAPATGYELDTISAKKTGDVTVDLTKTGDNYTFNMPAANVSVAVTWKEKDTPPPLDVVATPTADPPEGMVERGTTVTLDCETDGAEIWYTTDESTPAKDGAASAKYEDPIEITAATVIKAIAVKDGMTNSAVLTATYTVSNIVYAIYSGGVKTGANSTPWDGAFNVNTVPGRTAGNAASFTSNQPWGGFSIQITAGIDFDTFDALSFWVKSPNGAVIECGFGGDDQNANGWEIKYAGNDDTGIVVGTEWQHVIVPLPVRKEVTTQKQAFFVTGAGLLNKTVHVDDISLITANSSIKSITLAPHEPIAKNPAVTPLDSFLPGMKVTYTVNNTDVSLFNPHVLFSKYFDIEYEAGGDATKSGNDVAPNAGGSTFTLTVSFGGKDGILNGTISAAMFIIIDDFAGLSGTVNNNTDGGYWASSWWAAFDQSKAGRSCVSLMGNGTEYTGLGRSNQSWDLSPLSTITFSVYSNDSTDNPCVGDTYRFGLDVGPDATHIEFFSPNFSVSEEATWETQIINLIDFKTNANVAITTTNLANVTGWRLLRVNGATQSGTIFIDSIRADE